MSMPIDIFAVLDALTDIDTARSLPVSVMLFIDPTADANVANSVRAGFATTASNARVRFCDYDVAAARPPQGCDLAVVVAGANGRTGAIASALRAAGVPVLTITNMPETVLTVARANEHPLLEEDVISPKPYVDGAAFESDDEFNQEPFPMTVDRTRTLMDCAGRWIAQTFRQKRLAFSIAFPFVRRPLANEFINSTSIQNAGIGVVFIVPGADMPLMTLNQVKMVLQIAAAYGFDIDANRAREIIGVVAGGFACRSIAREVAPLVPGAGWAIKGGIGAAGTQAMGRAALAYFENLSNGENALGSGDTAESFRSALHNAQVNAQPWSDAIAAAVDAAGSYIAEDARNAYEQIKPKVQENITSAKPYIDQAAATARPYVEEGAKTVASAAAKVAGFLAGKTAPVLQEGAKKAAPVAKQMAEGAFPFLTHAVSTAVPLAQDTVANFCKKQGIDPSQFAAQMADSFVEAANLHVRR